MPTSQADFDHFGFDSSTGGSFGPFGPFVNDLAGRADFDGFSPVDNNEPDLDPGLVEYGPFVPKAPPDPRPIVRNRTRNKLTPRKGKNSLRGVGSYGDGGGYYDDGALPWYGDFTPNDFGVPDLGGGFGGGDISGPVVGGVEDVGGPISGGVTDFGVGGPISGGEFGPPIDFGGISNLGGEDTAPGRVTGLPDVGGVIDWGPGSYIDNPGSAGGGGNLPGAINTNPFLEDVGGIEDVFGGGVLSDTSLGGGGIFSGNTVTNAIGTGLKWGFGIDLTSIFGGNGGGGGGSSSGNSSGNNTGTGGNSSGKPSTRGGSSGGVGLLGLVALAALFLSSKK